MSNTDSHLIACLAASQDEPAWFQRDYLLSNARATQIYSPVYVWVVRQAARVNGDYLRFMQQQYVVILAAFAFGYYGLAYRVCRSVPVSLLFSAAMIAPVRLIEPLGLGGPYDSVSRNLFAGCVPLVALALLRWKNRSGCWPIIGGIAGLLIYINPVGSVWVSAWVVFFLTASVLPRKRMIKPFAMTIFALAAVQLPYVLIYARLHAGHPPWIDSVVNLRAFLYSIYGDVLFHIESLVSLLFAQLRALPELTVGVILALSFGAWSRRSAAAWLVFTGVSAAILIGLGVPLIQTWLSDPEIGVTTEFELARSLRYLVPFGLLGLVEFWRIHRRRTWTSRTGRLAALLGLLSWNLDYGPFTDWVRMARNDWRFRTAYKDNRILHVEPMEALKQYTPAGSLIHAPNNLDARFVAKRPLYFTNKDINLFLLTDWAATYEWRRRKHLIQFELPRLDPAAAIRRLQQEGVDFWLMPQPNGILPYALKERLVWNNERLCLIRVSTQPTKEVIRHHG